MCRVLAYLGPTLPLTELLLEPENSLLNQSSAPDHHPLLQLGGWGFATFSDSFEQPERPLLYRRAVPAFYDDNCKSLVPSLSGTTVLAQIRAVAYGPEAVIADENCHPFWYLDAPFLLAHNGALPEWRLCQRALLPHCSDRWLKQMKGTTDSEFLYILLLSLFEKLDGDWQRTLEQMMSTIQDALAELQDVKAPLKLKLVLATRSELVAANLGADKNGNRDLTGDWETLRKADPHSPEFALAGLLEPLFLLSGRSYQDHPGSYQVTPCDEDEITTVVLASEILTNDKRRWTELPFNHWLRVRRSQDRCQIDLRPFAAS